MDYKDIFESVFKNATSEELGCFIRNEDVPFEYCEKAMKRKGFGWENKCLVAMRSDCPTSTLVKLCKNAGERFASRLFTEMKDIPEVVIYEFFKKDWMIYTIAQRWRLPDDIKRAIFDRFLIFDDCGNIINYSDYLVMFLENQICLPDDCWKKMDRVLEIYRSKNDDYGWAMRRNLVEIVRPMMTPLDDNYAITVIDDTAGSRNNRVRLMKLAANPSISDYALMELQVKCPQEILEDVNMIIAENEETRKEYRRIHR